MGSKQDDVLDTGEKLDKAASTAQREVRPWIMKFAKAFAVASSVYMLGRWNFSIAWVMVVLPIWVWREKSQAEKKFKRDLARKIAMNEKETVLACLEDLPSWVYFPDVERAEWLNKIIKQMWPFIDEYVKNLLLTSVEPNIKQNLPSGLQSFHFDRIDLGDIAPRIGGVKCYEKYVHRDEVIMDLEIFYAGDCDIRISVNRFKAGIKDLQLHGQLRVVMKPLIPVSPFLGAVTCYFLNMPAIDFNLTNMADVFDIPGLSDLLHKIISDQIAAFMVLPNRLPVTLAENVDLGALQFPQPDGVLRVCVVEARDLVKADMSVMGKGKSDPYCVLDVGAQQFKTKVISNTVTPHWNMYCEAIVDVYDAQMLEFELRDEDPGNKDDFLGRCSLSIADVARKGTFDGWIPLEEIKKGELHVQASWLSLSNDINKLPVAQSQVKELESDHQLTVGMLLVHVDSAKHLPNSKKSASEPSPYVVVTVANDKQESFVKMSTNDPVWEQNFRFLCTNPEIQELSVQVFDKKTGKQLGLLEYDVRQLLTADNMDVRQPFTLSQSGPDSQITVRLRLRIFEGGPLSRYVETVVEKEDLSTIRDGAPGAQGAPGAGSPSAALGDIGDRIGEFGETVSPGVVGDSFKTVTVERPELDSSGVMPEVSGHAPVDPTHVTELHTDLRNTLENGDTNETEVRQRGGGGGDRPEEVSHGLGRLQLTIRHSPQRGRLTVVVHKAESLIATDKDGLSDPYVKMYLLPDRSKDGKRKTDVCKDTLNPVWDETLEFPVSHEELSGRVLEITIKNEVGKFASFRGRIIDMGQLYIDLTTIDLTSTTTAWYNLEPIKDDHELFWKRWISRH